MLFEELVWRGKGDTYKDLAHIQHGRRQGAVFRNHDGTFDLLFNGSCEMDYYGLDVFTLQCQLLTMSPTPGGNYEADSVRDEACPDDGDRAV